VVVDDELTWFNLLVVMSSITEAGAAVERDRSGGLKGKVGLRLAGHESTAHVRLVRAGLA
jgi:hypothetical protein